MSRSHLPVWNANQPSERARSADDHFRKMVDAFVVSLDLVFWATAQEPDKSETRRRLTPGPLKYDHFEVEVGADGFPIELGSGAIAITYRARDTVLNSRRRS